MSDYYIGWDVGAWHCDNNQKSRDALAVLTTTEENRLQTVGQIWRGNLREQINNSAELCALVNTCCATNIAVDDQLTIAIDTPLGLPNAVRKLMNGEFFPDDIADNNENNPYLFRQTERWLFENHFTPLSAITHMIGSQSTKGMHLIRKLGLNSKECGIWSSDKITAIETYPTPCLGSNELAKLFSSLNQSIRNKDKYDAVYCGLVAYLFATKRESLLAPVNNPPRHEGWIWIPVDVIEKGII